MDDEHAPDEQRDGDLWDAAWSVPERPEPERVRPRPQWEPGAASQYTDPRAVRGTEGRAATGRRPSGGGARGARSASRRESGARDVRRAASASARALAPRASVIEYGGGRRRSRGPALVASSVVLAIALIAFAWWFLTRPASADVLVTPPDAHVSFAGAAARPGRLLIEKLEPGTYPVTVWRAGFETRTVDLEVSRGSRATADVRLKPLPFKVTFASRPKGAVVEIVGASGRVRPGSTPCQAVAEAGTVTVSIALQGYNTFKSTFFLDSARAFDLLLDPEGQVVHAMGSLTAKGAPKGVAVTPDGREAWTAILNGPPSIEVFDLRTMKKAGGIDIGKYGAVEVIFNRAGTRAYASQMETAKVFEIDTKTRCVLREMKTGSSWTKVIALSPDEATLYAANWSGNDVSIIDLASGALAKRIKTAKTPRGLWPSADGKYLYVACFDTGDLQRIDLAAGTVTTLFKSGGALRHLVGDDKAGKLYASDMGKDVVWVLDTATGAVKKFCGTDAKPNTIELSPDNRVLFISNRGENNPKSYYIPGFEWGTVLLYDTTTGKPLDAIVGGNQCTALDVSADGRMLVFSDFLDDRLRVYAVPDYETLRSGGGGRFARHFTDLKKKR